MDRKQLLLDLMTQRKTMKEIGRACGGVSRQRIYQLLTKYQIDIPGRTHGFWKKQPPANRWLWRTLCSKPIPKKIKWELYEYLSKTLPTHCPILGIELNYESGKNGKRPLSPSIDRINSSKGYEINNVHIISWRANRIKNDSTPEELKKIYDYLTQ